MKTIIQITTLLYVFLFADTIALSTTLHVPANYTTIEAALNAATTNDTVLVQPGTYNENIIWPLVHGIKLISAGDTTNTIISGNDTNRVIRFLTNFKHDSTTEINGFTITNGNGGMYLYWASPKLINLSITGNNFVDAFAYGGGIYCKHSSPIIENVSITYNIVDGLHCKGAGLYFDGGSSNPYLSNVLIAFNSMAPGANWYLGTGIFCESSNITLDNVEIISNTSGNGGEQYQGGGAYFLWSSCEMNQVNIDSNIMGDGGSFSFYGGGGVKFYNSYCEMNRVTINSNVVGDSYSFQKHGAGIYCEGSSVLYLTNVLIANNHMGNRVPFTYGLGIYCDDESFFVAMNVTIAGNTIADSSNMGGRGVSIHSSNFSYLTNSISWNEGIGPEVSGYCLVNYSNIRGPQNGTGNINSYPMFVSENDFHLQSVSPCVDTGTMSNAPLVDIEGKPRPIEVSIDMGAYEFGNPEVNFNGNDTIVCEGDVINFIDLSGGEPASWMWLFEGGTPSVSNDQFPNITYDSAGVFDVQLDVFYGSSSYTELKTNYIVVATVVAQANTPIGETMVCNENVIVYTTDSVPDATSYQWDVSPSDAGIITGDSIEGILFADSAWTGNFTIKVRAMKDNCPGGWSEELQAELTTIPLPYFLTGTGPYCEGTQGSELILESSELEVEYELYLDNNPTGIIVAGTGSSVSFGYVTAEGLYTAIGFKSETCASNMWGDVWVYSIALPAQPSMPAGPAQVCNNDSTHYSSLVSNNADTLLWILNPFEAGDIIYYGDSITIYWNNEYFGLAYLSCEGMNECGIGLISDSLEIEVIESPSPEISGLTLVCKNNDADYETDYIAGTTYLWNVTGGEIIAGAGTNLITIGWGDPGTGYINLLETNAAGCEQQTDDFTVTIDECPGINNQSITSFSLIPNPTRDWILIKGNENILTISVLDIIGNVVINRKIFNKNEVRLDLSELPAGIYVFRIRGENIEDVHEATIIKID